MRIDFDKIQELVKLGYLRIEKHPFADLYIICYTKKTSIESHWNDITLSCRGLIVDAKGNIIAKPFDKFFDAPNLPAVAIPSDFKELEITEKIDGSLGILYWLGDRPFIASKSSFTSYQALIGSRILHKKYRNVIPYLKRDCTYLFEIVSPQNRVIVDYADLEDLFLLQARDHDFAKVDKTAVNTLPFPKVKSVDRSVLENEKLLQVENKEGYVVRCDDRRIKLRTEWYRLKYLEVKRYKELITEAVIAGQSYDHLLGTNVIEDLIHFRWIFERTTSLYQFIFSSAKANYGISNNIVNHNKHELLKTFKKLSLASQYFSKEIEWMSF